MNMVQIGRENYDEFLLGLRVLAVHDDPVRLKILELALRRWEFRVTVASQVIMANLLREDKDQFDLIISKVQLPDMDGFKRIKLDCRERELPVIMVSANRDLKLVIKKLKSTQHLRTRKTFDAEVWS